MEKTEKVDNLDEELLDGLFAELDQQNAIIAAEEAEKAELATVKNDANDDALEDEIGDILEDPELLAMAEAVKDEPTVKTTIEELKAKVVEKTEAQAKLDAEQELDLDEALNAVKEPTAEEIAEQEITADDLLQEVQVEHLTDAAVETHQDAALESTSLVAAEADETVEVQDKTIPDFQPKQAARTAKTEKEMTKIVALKYAPDIQAFTKDIAFTDATLDLAMRSQASLVAYQNERAARTTAQASRVKLKFDSLEALLYESYRKHFLESGEKVTEKAVENAVRKDSRWIKAKEALIEAEMYADIHKGFVYALKDRNDMLIQQGAAIRQERQGQLRMSEAQTVETQRSAASSAMKKAY